ncbi:MAG: hypothetical protein ACRCZO_18870 [Cetobacterium sp.]
MGRCKRCGSNHIVKHVKKEITELYYPGSEIADRVKRTTLTTYKCHGCGFKKTKRDNF